MKRLSKLSLITLSVLGFASAGFSQVVLLNDTWADGSRSEQNLPTESAWFASSGSSLTATTGAMIADWNTSSSRMALTYFTDGSPVTLGIGNSLIATWTFTPTNVIVSPNTTRGLRVGLFDSSAGERYTSDSFSTGSSTVPGGSNYVGYVMNLNFATTFTTGSPIEVRERDVDITSPNLMGSSSQYTVLGSGPGDASGSSFTDNTQYTFTYTITRTAADSVDLTGAWSGGVSTSFTMNDASSATYAFDTFAIRSDGQDAAAGWWETTNFKVEFVPEPTTFALLGLGGLALLVRRRF